MTAHEGVSIRVEGRVQGVGFRPFVHRLARALSIVGRVRNVSGDVEIEAEGAPDALARFLARLEADAPPLARVERVEVRRRAVSGHAAFAIEASVDDGSRPVLTPDAAVCDACLAELRDPRARRFRYAFLNCTDCGPRLTIVTGAPYDRARTTMAGFAMCDACQAEHDEPRDRRFHAQPIACPACGPRLTLRSRAESGPGDVDPIADAAARLAAGELVAIKALGGYQLACDARNTQSVLRMRARKQRRLEPFALMVSDLAAARRLVHLGPSEARWLEDRARPIVLAARRESPLVAEEVAPGLDQLGVMLPSAPLHHLLFDALAREGHASMPLVMTSANVHAEPMAYREADRPRVYALADAVLDHDRAISVRCDDSVVRVVDGVARPIRVGRGLAPLVLALPHPLALPTLALGGHLKASCALGEGERAILGPHAGDLDHLAAQEAYETALARLSELHRFTPARLALDAHPDYATRAIAARLGTHTQHEVLHHHAHAAACLAEHGVTGDALALTYDGAGLGEDGTLWGGEILVGRIARMRRVGSLRAVALPGGDRASEEPWRMALAHLHAAGLDPAPVLSGIDAARVRGVTSLLAERANAPRTSSVGRLFDAVAFLAGLAPTDRPAGYEAEAPMRLEAAARPCIDQGLAPYPFAWDGRTIDPAPMLGALLADRARGAPVGHLAARFHLGLAAVSARAVGDLATQYTLRHVALTGGVFLNAVLDRALTARLVERGLTVLRHERVPPNDGGLAYGQLAVVAARDVEARATAG